jgi:hypothetical protein
VVHWKIDENQKVLRGNTSSLLRIRHLAQRAMKVSPRCLLGRREAQFQLAVDSAREVTQMWLCSAPPASGGLTVFSE